MAQSHRGETRLYLWYSLCRDSLSFLRYKEVNSKNSQKSSNYKIVPVMLWPVADPRGGAIGAIANPPPREVEKITSFTIVVNFCAYFVGVPVISALFSNQAPSTINIMKIAVCRMRLVRYQLLLPRLVATSWLQSAAGQIFFSVISAIQEPKP